MQECSMSSVYRVISVWDWNISYHDWALPPVAYHSIQMDFITSCMFNDTRLNNYSFLQDSWRSEAQEPIFLIFRLKQQPPLEFNQGWAPQTNLWNLIVSSWLGTETKDGSEERHARVVGNKGSKDRIFQIKLIGSGNGLVPEGAKPLPEPMLSQKFNSLLAQCISRNMKFVCIFCHYSALKYHQLFRSACKEENVIPVSQSQMS